MRILKLSTIIICGAFIVACNYKNSKAVQVADKELYLPSTIYMVPDSNNYNNDSSQYCYSRMVQSKNIAMFWDKEYGNNPMDNPDENKRFNPTLAINECERFYNFYTDSLKMVIKGNTLFDKYKLLIFVIGGTEATAFGGGEADKVGILWTPALRINKLPYGALAHEMAHCFQYISNADNGTGPTGPIIEMSAQYMLWQVYPNWQTFENYHLKAFMEGTHYAFLHPANMYHSPYVLEYWAHKHGLTFFGNLCRATQPGDDPVTTYKRMNNLSQLQFNNEMFDAARRFITWDLKRVASVAKPYYNNHITKLNNIGNGWYQIDTLVCPQNYGYNAVKLNVPAFDTAVEVQFKGIAGAKGYNNINADKAGWRYGFVAYLNNGKRVYSDIFSQNIGKAVFNVPQNTTYLWFVVMGAPQQHWPVVFNWEKPAGNSADEQWPYQISVTGTTIHESVFN